MRKNEKNLKPEIHDIVIFKDSKGMKKFGRIISIDTNQMVTLQCLHHGTPITRQFHIRLLNLLFRKQEWNEDVPAKCQSDGANPEVNHKLDEMTVARKQVYWKCPINQEVPFLKHDPPSVLARLSSEPVAPNPAKTLYPTSDPAVPTHAKSMGPSSEPVAFPATTVCLAKVSHESANAGDQVWDQGDLRDPEEEDLRDQEGGRQDD